MSLTRLFVLMALLLTLPSMCFSTIPDSLRARIDSLQAVASVSHGMQRYEAEFKIAWDLFDIDNPIAVDHAGLAYEIALAEKDTVKIVRSGRLYGQLLRRTDKPDEAVALFNKVLPLAEKRGDQLESGRILNALAVLYTYQGKSDLALAAHLKSLRIQLTTHDTLRAARSYLNIGVLYYLLDDFKESITFFEKAIEAGDSSCRSNGFSNLAMAQLYLDKVGSFPRLMNLSLLNSPSYARQINLIQYEAGFGMYYLKRGAIDSAEHFMTRALHRAQEAADTRLYIEAQIILAQCASARGHHSKAIRDLRAVEESLVNTKFDFVRARCYEAMSSALEGNGKWKESLKYKQRELALMDSLHGQTIQTQMAIARVEFEARESQLNIARQAELLELSGKVISQQRSLNIISVSLALVLVGVVVMLYRFNLYQRRISRQLDDKVFERTSELRTSEGALARVVSEQAALMQLVSRKVKASMATFRGLWYVEAMDRLNDESEVNEKFEATARELLQVSMIVDRSGDLRTGFADGSHEIETDAVSSTLY